MSCADLPGAGGLPLTQLHPPAQPSSVQHTTTCQRPKRYLIQTLHPVLHTVVTALFWAMLGPHPAVNVALSLCGSAETCTLLTPLRQSRNLLSHPLGNFSC